MDGTLKPPMDGTLKAPEGGTLNAKDDPTTLGAFIFDTPEDDVIFEEPPNENGATDVVDNAAPDEVGLKEKVEAGALMLSGALMVFIVGASAPLILTGLNEKGAAVIVDAEFSTNGADTTTCFDIPSGTLIVCKTALD